MPSSVLLYITKYVNECSFSITAGVTILFCTFCNTIKYLNLYFSFFCDMLLHFLILNQASISPLFSSSVKSAAFWQHWKGFKAFCLLQPFILQRMPSLCSTLISGLLQSLIDNIHTVLVLHIIRMARSFSVSVLQQKNLNI